MKDMTGARNPLQRILHMQLTLKQLVPLAILAGLLACGSTVGFACNDPNKPGNPAYLSEQSIPQFTPRVVSRREKHSVRR